MNTAWYDATRRVHPKAVTYATKLTREGELDTKRYGGPGRRSKNPKRFDDAKPQG